MDSIFIEFIEYVFGSWDIWFRFTITAVLLRRMVGDAILKGSSSFWNFISGIFRKEKSN